MDGSGKWSRIGGVEVLLDADVGRVFYAILKCFNERGRRVAMLAIGRVRIGVILASLLTSLYPSKVPDTD
jgi:hypothetical protein